MAFAWAQREAGGEAGEFIVRVLVFVSNVRFGKAFSITNIKDPNE